MNSDRPSVLQVMLTLVLPIYIPTLFNATARGAALVLLPLYALENENGAVVAAAIVGLRSLGTMISDVPSGQLTARIGDKAIMLVGLGCIAIASVGASVSNSPFVLGTVAFVIGVGSGAWILGRLSLITENVHTLQRGRVIAVLAGLERAGATIGPMIGGLAAALFGFSWVFIGIGVLTLVAIGFIAIYSSRSATRTREGVQITTLQVLIRHRSTYLRAGGVMICLSYLRSARQLLIPVIGHHIGLGPAEIGFIFGISSLVDFLMSYPAALILDHIGRKAALIPAMALMSLAILLLPLADSYILFLLVSAMSGLGNGFGTGIFMTLGGDYSPRFGRSQFLGIWRLIGDSGGAIGPFAIGSITQVLSLGSACLLSGGLGLIGALGAVLVIKETLERPHKADTIQ